MSQAELDTSYAWLKQRDAIKAYRFLIELQQHPDTFIETHTPFQVLHRMLDQAAIAHLIKVLNALILYRWSNSGLRQIKKAAWRLYETDYKLSHEGRRP